MTKKIIWHFWRIKIPSQQNLSDLFVQLESLLTTTFNPLTTLLTTNFLKPWQSLAISGRTFSSDISRSQRFWQLLATPEYKRKRRGRTFEWDQVNCGEAAWRKVMWFLGYSTQHDLTFIGWLKKIKFILKEIKQVFQ